MKIYLASSWRNIYQADVLAKLREAGHFVYDFKNPKPGDVGFSWAQCNPDLREGLTAESMRAVLSHPRAVEGFKNDFEAMVWADICVLLLPSGNSAHLEAGWFSGQGLQVAVLAPEIKEPELMYKCFDLFDGTTPMFGTVEEVLQFLGPA